MAARRGSAWSQSRSSGRSVVSPVGEMNGVDGLAAGTFPLPPTPRLRRPGTLVLSPKERRVKSPR